MMNHEDGSVTLSKDEFTELGEAYSSLYYLLLDMPAFLSDFFDEREDYLNVVKWEKLLHGNKFDPSDWDYE